MAVRILVGDASERLRDMPDESVHCVVTSPPYFGLRDYGTAQWDGGEAACDHIEVQPQAREGRETPGGRGGSFPHSERPFKRQCGKCGALRIDRQIGLEPSPAEYVETLVAVFREVRRVLRKDGTLWLNLGDSYNANQGSGFDTNQDGGERKRLAASPRTSSGGLPPKNLLGIPWRVAFALQADGWWLRQDIIWSKPNPMPESVQDRCTKAHEYMFLLSKSERYWFDQDAIAEPCKFPEGSWGRTSKYDGEDTGKFRTKYGDGRRWEGAETRNKRSVWEIATAPYPEAHFATFPPALVEPCILAGAPRGGTVLDPFGGAGTTALVADRLGRDAFLIELNPAYAEMARSRVIDDAGMFAEVA